jgi:outer membrane protein OmpA-like peptidoglycan-associated protein
MKNLPNILALFCVFGIPQVLSSQVFRVQIAAYDQPQPESFFADKGIENYLELADKSGIFWYSTGMFANREEAELAHQKLIESGFQYAIIIDEEEQRALAGTECSYIKDGVVFVNRPLTGSKERVIYFDFGKFGLSSDSKETLDDIYQKMRQNPKSTLKIKGFTDGIGDGVANLKLAGSRSRSARDYLIYKGIKADRMFMELYGEAEPAAPNAEDDGSDKGKGQDLPENRKWNRRVLLVIETPEKPSPK